MAMHDIHCLVLFSVDAKNVITHQKQPTEAEIVNEKSCNVWSTFLSTSSSCSALQDSSVTSPWTILEMGERCIGCMVIQLLPYQTMQDRPCSSFVGTVNRVQGQGSHQKVMLRSLDCMERIEVVCLWSATPCQGPLSLEEQLQARHDISSLNGKNEPNAMTNFGQERKVRCVCLEISL